MKKLLLSTLVVIISMVTANAQPICGGTFTDPAGPTANYFANSDYTVTITPTNPGDVVTVTFTEFNTEATFDALYVYNGSSTSSSLFASTNAGANVPGGLAGGYWGNTIPGPFTSTDPSGALTFRFRSDGSLTLPGWIANVTCAPAPTCLKPTALTATAVTHNSATLGWTEPNGAAAWEVVVVPCGAPAPLPATVGETVTANPYVKTGLTGLTCYSYYVRSICSPTDKSIWAGPFSFTTLQAPPACNGQFIDAGGANGNYPNSSDSTVTICPETANSVVTVTFTSFATETGWDALYVYDGNSTNASLIPSANAAGNVPGGLAGGYWGTVLPGPFTSSDASGCLTFRFRSDGSSNAAGWIANVTCEQQTGCRTPNALTSSTTSNSVTLSWTENNQATAWEVLTLPCDATPPTSADQGQAISSNPTTISGLAPSTCYVIYLRTVCGSGEKSTWASKRIFTAPVNDECSNAVTVPVNNSNCSLVTPGILTGATASQSIPTTCTGAADDDIWFKFTATATDVAISFQNLTGTSSELRVSSYSGSCGSLTQFGCSQILHDLTVGDTYYLRVYTTSATAPTYTFNMCLTTISTCANSQSVCGINNYINTTNVPSLGTIGCLFTTPNATYFNLKIAESGPVNLQLSQTDFSGVGRDVDYAAWGPFASKEEGCAAMSSGQAPGIGVPVTLTTGCSYSTAATEYLNIANAVAGQYYIVLITNFSNQPGYINMFQTNTAEAGAGSIDCSGIRLNAFVDTNTNGMQDSNEVNFPLGQFQYSINASSNIHHVTSPTGIHTVYDEIDTNVYSLSHVINPEFSSMYSSSATYNNVIVTSGGMTVYNFPVIVTQNYNDVGVSLLPLSNPRAGSNYQVKIVYTNYGSQTVSGSLTFTKDPTLAVTIASISQSGTVATANGFTYNYANLLPYESRNIIVTLSVPNVPGVALGQQLNNGVVLTPVSGDLIANNNSSNLIQTVTGSYDPNDKSENHGGKILYSTFTANDYLYYTIRFENTGNAPALNVRVTDLLDNRLNEESLVMINSSHAYALDRVGQSLTWSFNNIMLPVSIANTQTGKGYINFKIKPKSGFAIGDIIPNTASIYFDGNEPIITNTFYTEFVQALGNQYYDFNNLFALSPVPARHFLNITIKQDVTMTAVNIYNTLGQLVQTVNNPNETIDVSGLQAGTYFIKILSDKGIAGSKFIKQ